MNSVASRSVATLERPRQKNKIEPYVSPFVLKAKQKAEERAKLARQKLRRQRSPARDEWNMDTTPTGLFDPKLRKQEIFRLGPQPVPVEAEKPREPAPRSVQHRKPSPRLQPTSTKNFVLSNAQSVDQYGKERRDKTRERAPNSLPSYLAPTSSSAALAEGLVSHRQERNRLTIRSSASMPQRIPPHSALENPSYQLPESVDHDEREPQDELLFPSSAARLSVSLSTDSTEPVKPSTVSVKAPSPPYVPISTEQAVVPTAMQPDNSALRLPSAPPVSNQGEIQPISPQPLVAPAPTYQAEDVQGVYKQMIRDRLRLLLHKHRAAPLQANNHEEPSENDEDTARRPMIYHGRGRHSGLAFRAAPHNHDSQIYMRDMMTSMAQIMTAVGEMVTNNAQNSRRHPRRRRSRSHRSASVISASPPRSPPVVEDPFAVHPTQPDAGKDLLAAAKVIDPPLQLSRKQTTTRRKHQALDLVMMKLQSIERCEQEIRDFLARPMPVIDLPKPPIEQISPSTMQSVSLPTTEVKTPTPSCSQGEPKQSRPVKTNTKEPSLWLKFPQLKSFQDHHENDEILRYMEEMNRIKKLKEVAFERKQSTSRITGDNVSSEIFDRLVRSVADDFEELFENYGESLIHQI